MQHAPQAFDNHDPRSPERHATAPRVFGSRSAQQPTATRVSEPLRSVRGITAIAVSPDKLYLAAGESMADGYMPQVRVCVRACVWACVCACTHV